jgi:thiol-disulfide isomerase/thioredoxin
MSDYDPFDGTACDCPLCRDYDPYLDNLAETEADDSLPSEAEIDAELDQAISDIFKNTNVPVDAPTDVEVVFAKVFDDLSVEVECGPIWSSVDEIETIMDALRFKGEWLCKKIIKIADPSRQAEWDALSPEQVVLFKAIIDEALVENNKLMKLYMWFSDEFGIGA